MSKKITINEIAKLAGTSKTTVSFYINGKTEKMSEQTREKIRQVIEETNYTPSVIARSLNKKRCNIIGVVIGDITNTFSNQIVKGIDDYAHSRGYQLIVGNSNYENENEKIYTDRMISMGVDGFIIQPTSQFKNIEKNLNDLGKKIVFIDSQTYDEESNWVKTNNYEATYEAIKESKEKGYKDFIIITADTKLLSTRIERYKGFVDALEEEKIEYTVNIIERGTKVEKIKEFLIKNIKINKKTLIFVPNCWALSKVFIALKEENIHNNVGIIGFDNVEWTNFSSPTITTIVQPAYEEGEAACKILIDQIEKNFIEEKNQILECYVNWKDSTN